MVQGSRYASGRYNFWISPEYRQSWYFSEFLSISSVNVRTVPSFRIICPPFYDHPAVSFHSSNSVIKLMKNNCNVLSSIGRAIAQASHRGDPGSIPGQVTWDMWWTKWHWGSILRVLLLSLPILIPPTTPLSSSIIRGCYNRPNSGRHTNWTQSHAIPRN
jgi:hypothetical protein